MYCSERWTDFELICCGNGQKLERWGSAVLLRPDPQVVWDCDFESYLPSGGADAYYERLGGGGKWHFNKGLPADWTVSYKALRFRVRPTGFKHTGLFPEQACNWDWLTSRILAARRPVRVLNLFAYTGGATVACAAAGASVVHVDAAKGMVAWAKENLALSSLSQCDVKFYVDDCEKLVRRELRRGNMYQGVVMDPPSYGRGPDGEMWKIEQSLFPLVSACTKLLQDPAFFLINSYTTGLAPTVLKNVLQLTVERRFGGVCEADEIGLPSKMGIALPCGASGRWMP